MDLKREGKLKNSQKLVLSASEQKRGKRKKIEREREERDAEDDNGDCFIFVF